jgi:hypothetical protein
LEIFHFKDFRFVVSFVLIVVYDGQDWAVYKLNACQNDKFPVESWCISGAQTSVLVDLIEKRISKAITRHRVLVNVTNNFGYGSEYG